MKHLNNDTLLVSSQQSAVSSQQSAVSSQQSANIEPSINPSDKRKFQRVETLKAYQLSVEVLRPLSLESIKAFPELLAQINLCRSLALKYLGAGFYTFNLKYKRDLYDRARGELGGLVALWKFHQPDNPAFVSKIEEILIPAYSALIRKLEKKIEKD